MYEFKWLNERLLLITWLQTPPPKVAHTFIEDLRDLVYSAENPFYILSDLRRGRIIDLRLVNEIAELSQHKNFAGSAAVSEGSISNLFTKTFEKSGQVKRETNMIFDRAEEAIGFLESLEPNLTQDIDWVTILNK